MQQQAWNMKSLHSTDGNIAITLILSGEEMFIDLLVVALVGIAWLTHPHPYDADINRIRKRNTASSYNINENLITINIH